MQSRFFFLISVSILVLSTRLCAQIPVDRWDFDDPDNLIKATTGNDLVLTGSHTAAEGVSTTDGAVTIGIGSYYTCTHGIAANGGGSYVNQWSLLIDFKVPSLGPWYCFYQTNPANSTDGDCFVRQNNGQIGVSATGYSSTSITADTWYRMVITVNNTTELYDIYLDGTQILDGNSTGVDGRFSLASTLLLFADDNGEDAAITVSTVAIYDHTLTSSEIANLGTAIPTDISDPVGQWDFNNPDNLTLATIGDDLVLTGSQTAAAGVSATDGAVTIGIGSYYTCTHEIAANGGGTYVNQWSLLIDFKVPLIDPWYCFFQTNPANSDDGDCFVQTGTGRIGVGSSGYSSMSISPETWYRMVVTVDSSNGLYDIYLDGTLILDGNSPGVDGRFSLASTLLLFADDNGEDAAITVSTVAIYNRSLTSTEIANLGTVIPKDPNNHPPEMVVQAAGAETAEAGTASTYIFEATDPDNDTVNFFINWGDGNTTGWSSLASVLNPYSTSHVYGCPGTYSISAKVKDEHGLLSEETFLQTVTVSGTCIAEFLTEPFLQNVKPDGITIMWELDLPVLCTVEYGLTEAYGSNVVVFSESSSFSTYIFKAILTGLEPFTIYHYRVIVSETVSEDFTFRTGTDEHIDFAFSVWSDSQGGNGGTYPTDYNEPTNSMMRHMRDDADIHFGTNSGDLAESGGSYSVAHAYYVDRVGKYLGQSKAWFSAWGNHDAGRDAVMRLFADMPSKDRTDLINGTAPTPGWGSFSFNYAGCHFIMIDNDSSGYDVLNWLEADLQSEANLSARFTFLNVHQPPYCEVWVTGNSFYQSYLVPLMEEYGVDACFSGHTHAYERGYQNGVFYCVTGGGSWLDITEPLVYEWPLITVGGYSPLAIDVSELGLGGEYGIINEYVKVSVTGNSWKATGLGFRPNGEFYGIIDEFGVTGPEEPTATPTETTQPTPTATLEPAATATQTPFSQPTATPTEPASMVESWPLQQ